MDSNQLIKTLLDSNDGGHQARMAGYASRNLAATSQLAGYARQDADAAMKRAQIAEQKLAEMRALLVEAQNTTKEWQASHDAWRDLAQTLRDEAKACPNAEAHRFGKDESARRKHFSAFGDKRRIELGLKPQNIN